MARRSFHVVPHDRGWALKEEGRQNPLAVFDTQREAIDEGRTKAINDDDDVDLVVHRTDGRIRERQTFGEMSVANGNGNGRTAPSRVEKTEVQPEDVIPVGSRISWSAMLAGLAVALTSYIALSVLGTAIGLTIYEAVNDTTLSYAGVIWAAVSWLLSLFIGGYVVSETTTNEKKGEAVIYGVVLWATMLVTLAVLGAALHDYGMGNLLERVLRPAVDNAEPVTTDAATLAWITFGSIVLSLLAAIAGALVGAGPELVFVRRPDGETAVVKS